MPGDEQPLIWSPEAHEDLSDIWNYYAGEAGRRVANSVVEKIRNAAQPLGAYLHLGRSRENIRGGLRSIVVDPYLIFYRVSLDGTVSVVRVLHGRRDIDDAFADG